MKTIVYLLQKEFLQIFRHRIMLPLIFVMPIIQLLILAHAADYEVKHIRLVMVDQDNSSLSLRLRDKFDHSPYFDLAANVSTPKEALELIQQGTADLFIEIPVDFGRDLQRSQAVQLQISVDAINGVKAGLAGAYANAIIAEFNQQVWMDWGRFVPASALEIVPSYRFNPSLDYQTFMVPGILVILVTLVGMFLSGMNIVKEKEIGTIEQINVTPIRKYQFIIGKLLPFWIIALVELSFGLVVAKLVFDIPFVGSLGLIYGFAALYLLLVLGMGLFISTITETQQQAMFIAWFFLMIFVLMSGLFTPIESMPNWAQQITRFNPIAYFVEVMRMVLLKGSGWEEVQRHFTIIGGYALMVNGLAVWNYRKTS
ncbi:MAG TPA: ABC transporter permease [Saprospiraceae bacterium]|nr:ABC transporter permease [Saprospiraceae bacterium]HMQ84192.1 ABC transporter permease [Saprospiraceae bacterium]